MRFQPFGPAVFFTLRRLFVVLCVDVAIGVYCGGVGQSSGCAQVDVPLLEPLQSINSSHWFTIVGGRGAYHGQHHMILGHDPGTRRSWQVRVKTRITHILVDPASDGVMLLPKLIAASRETNTMFKDSNTECFEILAVLRFVRAAMRGQWQRVAGAFIEAELIGLLARWLATEDAELLGQIAAATGHEGHMRRTKVFYALARAVEGCYPGVEKITACSNLKALLPVVARSVLHYPLSRTGALAAIVSRGHRPWRRMWFDPTFWAAVVEGTMPIEALVRQPAKGIFLFPMFTPRFALQLSSLLLHFRRWTRSRRLMEVSENAYITLLDEIGVEGLTYKRFVRRFVAPLASRLLPHESTEGVDGRAYAFVRHFSTHGDQRQYSDGVHHDEATVTVNIGLSRFGSFSGGNLSFCGVFGDDDYRKHLYTLDWSALPPGMAVLHAGLRRHASMPVLMGQRMNLVIWAISSSPRGVSSGDWETKLVPDAACLSRNYDADFTRHSHTLVDDFCDTASNICAATHA